MARYTAVFEWPEGEQPRVGVDSSWLGGKICSVAFYDALEDVDGPRVSAPEPTDDDVKYVLDLPLRSEAKPEHVCGLQGFNVATDHCPACTAGTR